MVSTTATHFVLREGATQEEQWTWDEIADRCRSGEFGAGTRIFMPAENRWVCVEESDLYAELTAHDGAAASGETGAGRAERAEREALEREYADALEQIEQSPDSVDVLIAAGSVAAELGDKDAARAHFQGALDRNPFHARVANEVKRRFGAAECRSFRLLERPAPVWDNVADLLNFALASGWLYLAAPAAAFAALLFVPGGGVVVGEVAVLWCYLSLCAVAAGRTEPPSWGRMRKDPLHQLLVPGVALTVVSVQWLVVFWGVARIGMLLEHKHDVGVLSYIGASPVLTIAMTLCALCYLPAVMVLIRPSMRATARVLLPWVVVRAIVKMELEYATSALLLFAVAVVVGVVGVVTGGIPVVGKLVWAGAVALAVPASAFILGRMRSRTAHVFDAQAYPAASSSRAVKMDSRR